MRYNQSTRMASHKRNIANSFEAEKNYSQSDRGSADVYDTAPNTMEDPDMPNTSQNETITSAPEQGGVRIPTFAEFQSEQENKRLLYFQEQQRAAEAQALKRIEEDKRKIDEIHDWLRSEIEKYEKAQHAFNENLEKVKKMLILEQQQAKAGIYHITHAEVLAMMFRTFLVSINESNTWLEALISKKSKGGSLFAVRSKQKGTQYSMSQELTITRAVQ